ncbi:MAG TPA: hypothetical protein VER37_00320 [Thermomicrobiales bacterium]|nr:hypothetical protein [Thermomicrobiales bacterium]
MAIQRHQPVELTEPTNVRTAGINRNMSDPAVVAAAMQRLRDRVVADERRFGLPSADTHAAIDRGDLVETFDVCRWMFAADSLVRAESRAPKAIPSTVEPR